MRSLALFLALFSIVTVGRSQTTDAQSRELMTQIVNTCEGIRELTFPRPEARVDREAEDFTNHARWLERDLAKLRETNPAAIDSPTAIRGKPFNARVQAALAIVEKNRSALEADKVARPNPNALSQVDFAIVVARKAAKETEGFDGLSMAYQVYSESLDKAKSLDARALDARRSELAEVQETFVKKYTTAKDAHEKQIAVAEAKQAAAEAITAKQENDLWEKKKAESKALGYKHPEDGIVNLLDQLRDGLTSLADAKTLLVYHDPSDDFQVQSVVGSHVIFGYKRNSSEFIQVALVREKDAFYGEGTRLSGESFAVVGSQRFTTVLGAEKEILVLKRVR